MSEATGANPFGAVTVSRAARAEAPVPARRGTSQVSGHILAPAHGLRLFWCSEKLLLPFEERNGGSEKRI